MTADRVVAYAGAVALIAALLWWEARCERRSATGVEQSGRTARPAGQRSCPYGSVPPAAVDPVGPADTREAFARLMGDDNP